MKQFLLFAGTILSFTLSAQTYFYIDQISINPGTPTDQDVVSIDLIGNLSNGGSFVASAIANVSGSTVTIDITADSQGGIGVLIPHTENVEVGLLAMGQHNIVLNTNFVLDGAAAPQHQFTVTGLGTGISELGERELQYRINDGTFQAQTDDGSSIGDIYIYDLNGKEVLTSSAQGSSITLELGELPSGVYLLQNKQNTFRFYLQ